MEGRGHVFIGDFLERRGKYRPVKDLDIFLNVSGFRIRVRHDEFEKIGTFGLAFADSEGSESFEVPSDSVFFLDAEPNVDQRLEEINAVDRGDKKVVVQLPVNAGHRNAVTTRRMLA